jgi:hypothetical protein
LFRVAGQRDLDAAALRSELDRVRQQIPHDLLEPRRVAVHAAVVARRHERQDDAL